jgi:hypothetical protein
VTRVSFTCDASLLRDANSPSAPLHSKDMGAVEAARAIEPLCMLWRLPGGVGKGDWSPDAFKLLR